MLSVLKQCGQFDNTVIIITSDHGENIGEHGHMDHVFSLYNTTLKNPLIIHNTNLFGKGWSDHRQVQLLDLFPTILEIAQIDSKLYPSSGISLLEPEEAFLGRPIFTEYYYPKQQLEVIRDWENNESEPPELERYKRKLSSYEVNGIKLIWSSNGIHELYDVGNDPGEEVNLAPQDPEKVSHLINELKAYEKSYLSLKAAGVESVSPVFDKEGRDHLKALGYLK